jgi:hypothetical protein
LLVEILSRLPNNTGRSSKQTGGWTKISTDGPNRETLAKRNHFALQHVKIEIGASGKIPAGVSEMRRVSGDFRPKFHFVKFHGRAEGTQKANWRF